MSSKPPDSRSHSRRRQVEDVYPARDGQQFGPALSDEIGRHRRPLSTTWLVDKTYVKILGKWHYLYRSVDLEGQVLDCWLSRTRDLAAALAFFRRTIGSTGCTPEHVVTDKAAFYPSALRICAPGAKHTATGFYNLVIAEAHGGRIWADSDGEGRGMTVGMWLPPA